MRWLFIVTGNKKYVTIASAQAPAWCLRLSDTPSKVKKE
jgi:hypothetical protein